MRDARDAEDERLLANGEIDLLLAGWVETIRGRCIARLGAIAGEDAAQAVGERLWRELKAGKHRDSGLPFRVVVAMVVKWTCAGWFERTWVEWELGDWDAPAPDESAAVEWELDLETFVASLPPGDGDVARLTWLEGLEPGEAAALLQKEPNAVYQAIHRNKRKLREWLET